LPIYQEKIKTVTAEAKCRADGVLPHFCYSGYESNRMAQFTIDRPCVDIIKTLSNFAL
jgi:hypothetical protein